MLILPAYKLGHRDALIKLGFNWQRGKQLLTGSHLQDLGYQANTLFGSGVPGAPPMTLEALRAAVPKTSVPMHSRLVNNMAAEQRAVRNARLGVGGAALLGGGLAASNV